MNILKPYIFISYASEDVEFVYHLTRLLEQEQFRVWMDKKRLIASHDWWQEIEEGIINCDAFIIVMSPKSKESDWVKREILLAEKKEKLIFPILLQGEIWSRLADKQYVDMSLNKQAKLEDSFIQYLKQQIGEDIITNKNEIIDKKDPEDRWTITNKIALSALIIGVLGFIMTLLSFLLANVWARIPQTDITDMPANIATVANTQEVVFSDSMTTDIATSISADVMESPIAITPISNELGEFDIDEWLLTLSQDEELQTIATTHLRYLQTTPLNQLNTINWCATQEGIDLSSQATSYGFANDIISIVLILDDSITLEDYVVDLSTNNMNVYGLASGSVGTQLYFVLLLDTTNNSDCITNKSQ